MAGGILDVATNQRQLPRLIMLDTYFSAVGSPVGLVQASLLEFAPARLAKVALYSREQILAASGKREDWDP